MAVCVSVCVCGRGLVSGRDTQEGHTRAVESAEGIFQITRDGGRLADQWRQYHNTLHS